MSNLHPRCCLNFDFQKVDQHAGGKWLSDHNLASNEGHHMNTILSMTSYGLRRTIDSLERVRDGLQFSLGGRILPCFKMNINCLKFEKSEKLCEIEWVFPLKMPGHLLKTLGYVLPNVPCEYFTIQSFCYHSVYNSILSWLFLAW